MADGDALLRLDDAVVDVRPDLGLAGIDKGEGEGSDAHSWPRCVSCRGWCRPSTWAGGASAAAWGRCSKYVHYSHTGPRSQDRATGPSCWRLVRPPPDTSPASPWRGSRRRPVPGASPLRRCRSPPVRATPGPGSARHSAVLCRMVVVGDHLADAVAETDALGLAGGGGEEHLRGRGMGIFLQKVMLHLPGVVEALVRSAKRADLFEALRRRGAAQRLRSTAGSWCS